MSEDHSALLAEIAAMAGRMSEELAAIRGEVAEINAALEAGEPSGRLPPA